LRRPGLPLGVLSDSDILKRLRSGSLGVDPFAEANLTPNGYDLTLAEIHVAGGRLRKSGTAKVRPGGWFAAQFS